MGLTDADVALAAVRAGVLVVRRDYGHGHSRHHKTVTDFATQTDIDAEQAILAVISQHRPNDAVLGEESGATGDGSASRRWLVDPLCGTLNFAATTPLAAVNVALEENGDVQVSAVADPSTEELFWTDGNGAHLRRDGHDESLTPTAISTLVDINCDGPLDQPFLGGQLVADLNLRASFGPRVLSSTLAVVWVAAGRRAGYISDGHFRENVHFAAGIAVCEAAGCVISDLAGDPLHTGRGLVISADQETHDSLLNTIAPHLESLIGDQGSARVQTIYRRAHERGEIDLDRIPAVVLAMPFDLVRHDLLMTLKPLKATRIRSIVDDMLLPLIQPSTQPH